MQFFNKMKTAYSKIAPWHRFTIYYSIFLTGCAFLFKTYLNNEKVIALMNAKGTLYPVLVIILCSILINRFLFLTFGRYLREAIRSKRDFFETTKLCGFTITFLMLNYAGAYLTLYMFDNTSFNGIVQGYSIYHKAYVFFYYSCVTFATVGYGDIVPVSPAAQLITIMEIGNSILFLVLFVSQFSKIERDILSTKNDK